MAKKPDLSELTKKFDLNSLVGGIKSLLNPESEVPQVDPSDAIGAKIAQLSLMMDQMSKIQKQQSRELANASQLLNDLYKDLEALRNSISKPDEPGPTASSHQETPESRTDSETTDEKKD